MLRLPVYPTGAHYNADNPLLERVPEDLRDVYTTGDEWGFWGAIAKVLPVLGLQSKKT